MRREPEFFGEAELDLLYMSKRLREALKIEKMLNEANVEYLVETGAYLGGFLIKRELTGAFFYVSETALTEARELLVQQGYKPYKE